MTPIAALSGGERNRTFLPLFTRAANLLILDEPTNDLDVETLEARGTPGGVDGTDRRES
jgi:ATP-binding cassette subfamily F protein uup